MLAIAHRLPRQALVARVNALTMATNLKRAAVVAEARNQGVGGFPRTARWTGIGTLAGLTIALALAAFRRRPGNAGPADFPATPLVPGEY